MPVMANTWVESDNEVLTDDVVSCIRMVYDPEIPLNVYDLGLIYRIDIKEEHVLVTMTLTNPACPSGSEIAEAVKRSVELIESVKEVKIKLTFDPPYSPDMMSEAAKLELGFL